MTTLAELINTPDATLVDPYADARRVAAERLGEAVAGAISWGLTDGGNWYKMTIGTLITDDFRMLVNHEPTEPGADDILKVQMRQLCEYDPEHGGIWVGVDNAADVLAAAQGEPNTEENGPQCIVCGEPASQWDDGSWHDDPSWNGPGWNDLTS